MFKRAQVLARMLLSLRRQSSMGAFSARFERMQ
jgi:hypothetical protein